MNRDSRQPEPDASPSLAWLAFCYIADEMTATEKSKFEFRLKDDEQAQQAVVDAVQQTQWIAASQIAASQSSQPQPTTASPTTVGLPSQPSAAPTRSLARAGLLVAIAASLLFVVIRWNGQPSLDSPSPSAVDQVAANEIAGETQSEDLAIAWADTLVALDDDEFVDVIEEETALYATEDEIENWMFAALVDQSDAMEGVE